VCPPARIGPPKKEPSFDLHVPEATREKIGHPNAAKYCLTLSDVKTPPGTRIMAAFLRNLAAGTGPGGNPGPIRARIWGGRTVGPGLAGIQPSGRVVGRWVAGEWYREKGVWIEIDRSLVKINKFQ